MRTLDRVRAQNPKNESPTMPHANRHDKEEHTEQVTPDAMTRAVNAAAIGACAAVKAKTREGDADHSNTRKDGGRYRI